MNKNRANDTCARVFISCGQAKQSQEVEIARQIAERLRQVGFAPYVAVDEQTLRGLKENIFEQLRKSEYFIFIDFEREYIIFDREALSKTGDRRGSLFSHQELAVASFLEIDVLAFQEHGVKPDDGILRFLQANVVQFKDRHTLPNVIADKVQQRGWNPNWRNELFLVRESRQFSDAAVMNVGGKGARFFHINVHNRHRDKMATSCSVHLERVVKMDPTIDSAIKTVECKWAGTSLPYVGIAPGTLRQFDALHIFHDDPTLLQFNLFVDSSDYYPQIKGEGKYLLTYLVTADNFAVARGSFMLNLSSSLEQTTFELHPDDG